MMIFPFRLRIDCGDIFVKPSQEALVIEAKLETVDIFQRISDVSQEICEQLPHTPINGVGHNYAFELTSEEDFNLSYQDLENTFIQGLPKALGATLNSSMTASKINYTLRFNNKPYKLNLSFETEENKKRTIRFNFHHDLYSIDSEEFRNCLKSFSENYTTAQELKKEMVKTC